jgi:hypothetical protein
MFAGHGACRAGLKSFLTFIFNFFYNVSELLAIRRF